MSDTYTKLFSSITESTVWGESYSTRVVWVTMLAMADAQGDVYGAIPGLARRANVTLQEVEKALAAFLSPDPYSRTKDDDGRRIAVIDGGWRLINHAKYGEVRNAEERREYKREWDRKNRSRNPTESDKSDTNPTESDNPTPSALTPAPTKKEQKQKTAPQEDELLGTVSPEVAADFRKLRARLRAPITATAMKGILRESQTAGISLEAALIVCCERGWRGFKAEWVQETNGHGKKQGSADIFAGAK